jgi:hypothetical protein
LIAVVDRGDDLRVRDSEPGDVMAHIVGAHEPDDTGATALKASRNISVIALAAAIPVMRADASAGMLRA